MVLTGLNYHVVIPWRDHHGQGEQTSITALDYLKLLAKKDNGYALLAVCFGVIQQLHLNIGSSELFNYFLKRALLNEDVCFLEAWQLGRIIAGKQLRANDFFTDQSNERTGKTIPIYNNPLQNPTKAYFTRESDEVIEERLHSFFYHFTCAFIENRRDEEIVLQLGSELNLHKQLVDYKPRGDSLVFAEASIVHFFPEVLSKVMVMEAKNPWEIFYQGGKTGPDQSNPLFSKISQAGRHFFNPSPQDIYSVFNPFSANDFPQFAPVSDISSFFRDAVRKRQLSSIRSYFRGYDDREQGRTSEVGMYDTTYFTSTNDWREFYKIGYEQRQKELVLQACYPVLDKIIQANRGDLLYLFFRGGRNEASTSSELSDQTLKTIYEAGKQFFNRDEALLHEEFMNASQSLALSEEASSPDIHPDFAQAVKDQNLEAIEAFYRGYEVNDKTGGQEKILRSLIPVDKNLEVSPEILAMFALGYTFGGRVNKRLRPNIIQRLSTNAQPVVDEWFRIPTLKKREKLNFDVPLNIVQDKRGIKVFGQKTQMTTGEYMKALIANNNGYGLLAVCFGVMDELGIGSLITSELYNRAKYKMDECFKECFLVGKKLAGNTDYDEYLFTNETEIREGKTIPFQKRLDVPTDLNSNVESYFEGLISSFIKRFMQFFVVTKEDYANANIINGDNSAFQMATLQGHLFAKQASHNLHLIPDILEQIVEKDRADLLVVFLKGGRTDDPLDFRILGDTNLSKIYDEGNRFFHSKGTVSTTKITVTEMSHQSTDSQIPLEFQEAVKQNQIAAIRDFFRGFNDRYQKHEKEGTESLKKNLYNLGYEFADKQLFPKQESKVAIERRQLHEEPYVPSDVIRPSSREATKGK
ncbi:hypothetical protein SAMN05444392_10786 [Seinonella peptonophila]|uniref:Uncharacterized protein n=1 Tax=Seinonella peptonophila TaxID=112248 RepID=A0A1M4YQM0_9BACL|nr:hypothetical protein SAMN05444392_10786 [Seinonella peptonophila]